MFALLIVFLTVTQSRAADRDRLQAFLKVTGFDVALDSIALAAADAPEMLGMSASDFGSEWTRVADEVFDTAKMQGIALDILEQTLSDEMLTHAAEFYASPLGQRLVEVENASHMVDDDAAKRATGEELVARDVAEGNPRVGILRAMTAAIDASDSSVRAVQEIQVRFLMAASNAGVLEQELDEGMLRALMKESESDLRLSMQRASLAGAAYTYQDLSDDDLQAYVDALEHPTMQVVYELMNAVQYEVMANRFEVLAARMAELHPGQEL
nr:DUF2059 domain-containing protein [Roseovarius litorisediminis]